MKADDIRLEKRDDGTVALVGDVEIIRDLLHRASSADFACSHLSVDDQIMANELNLLSARLRPDSEASLRHRLCETFERVRLKYDMLQSKRKYL